MYETFLYGNKGLGLKEVHYNLIGLCSKDSTNDKIRVFVGHLWRMNLYVCGWGLVGKWDNLPIKLMFQFIFQITCLSL